MRLNCKPNVSVSTGRGKTSSAVVRFHDPARDIGRNSRGILLVDFDDNDLAIVSRCRVALRSDSDAVDYDAMLPDAAALIRASVGNINAEIIE